MYQTRYSDCVHARARAANAVRQVDCESIKQGINTMLTLSLSTMMDYHQNAKEVSVSALLKHKAETLSMYRKVICLNLAPKEEAILLGYIQYNITALDDAIKTSVTKANIYQV